MVYRADRLYAATAHAEKLLEMVSTITFDKACRLLMLDMRRKALGRALNLSQVAA